MSENKKEPIRVLQVIGVMNRGGAENMIMNLYRSVDKNHVQFDFVENSMEKAAFDDEIRKLGGKIYNCPHFTGHNLLTYIDWWKAFWKEHKDEYHIVHGHIGSTAAIYLGIAKKYGVYTIAHSHSSGTDHSLKSYLYKTLSYPTRYIADYFFACSQIAGIDRFGSKVVQSKNYSVLNNSIDTARFRYSPEIREKVRKEFGINESQYVIGHVGRYTSEKNHAFLIRTFKEVCTKRRDVLLMLVGDGPLHKEMENLVNSLGISDQVVFTGVRADVNELMQGFDLFMLPSIYEGLPVTMVEAQASGLKCIISDAVPTESIIVSGQVIIGSLSENEERWSHLIIDNLSYDREDTTQTILNKGYDIKSSSKWLEEFYEKNWR